MRLMSQRLCLSERGARRRVSESGRWKSSERNNTELASQQWTLCKTVFILLGVDLLEGTPKRLLLFPPSSS